MSIKNETDRKIETQLIKYCEELLGKADITRVLANANMPNGGAVPVKKLDFAYAIPDEEYDRVVSVTADNFKASFRIGHAPYLLKDLGSTHKFVIDLDLPKTTFGKLYLFDWSKIKGNGHPYCNAVMFHNGNAISTQGERCIVLKSNYPEEYENKYLKNGKIVENDIDVVSYWHVMPSDDCEEETVPIVPSKRLKMTWKARTREYNRDEYLFRLRSDNMAAYFPAKLLSETQEMIEQLSKDYKVTLFREYELEIPKLRWKGVSTDGHAFDAILMPIIYVEGDKNKKILNK